MKRATGYENRINRSPIHLLHRAGQCASDIFVDEITDTGRDLTPRQYAILVTVAENEGLSQTELVARTGVDRSTLADVVRRMLRKGLLQRRRTREDARAYAVRLTDEGERALHRAEPVLKSVDEKLLSALPATQREQFIANLATIIEVLNRSKLLPGRPNSTQDGNVDRAIGNLVEPTDQDIDQ